MSRCLLPSLTLFKVIDMERGKEEGKEKDEIEKYTVDGKKREHCCVIIEFLHLRSSVCSLLTLTASLCPLHALQ